MTAVRVQRVGADSSCQRKGSVWRTRHGREAPWPGEVRFHCRCQFRVRFRHRSVRSGTMSSATTPTGEWPASKRAARLFGEGGGGELAGRPPDDWEALSLSVPFECGSHLCPALRLVVIRLINKSNRRPKTACSRSWTWHVFACIHVWDLNAFFPEAGCRSTKSPAPCTSLKRAGPKRLSESLRTCASQ